MQKQINMLKIVKQSPAKRVAYADQGHAAIGNLLEDW